MDKSIQVCINSRKIILLRIYAASKDFFARDVTSFNFEMEEFEQQFYNFRFPLRFLILTK